MECTAIVDLDADAIGLLEETLGRDTVADMLEGLATEFTMRVENLRAARDAEAICREGHALTSLTGNFAMSRAYHLCCRIRKVAPTADAGTLRQLASELSEAVEDGFKVLERRYGNAPPT